MPQKLNKAGKMQDYIPKGNGDASGEYGTSNGTNKNFTTSDKKSSANVITENKSVVVGKKDKGYSEVEKADWGIKENEKQIATLEKSGKYPNMLKRLKEQNEILKKQKQEVLDGKREKIDLADDGIERKEGTLPFGNDNSNKANIIDGDLSGKGNYLNKEIAKLTGLSEKQINDNIKEMGFASSTDKTQDYYSMALQKKYDLPKYAEIKEEKHDKAWYEKADDNYAKVEQHLYTKQQEYENIPEIKQFYEKMGKDILRERKLIYDKLKEFKK